MLSEISQLEALIAAGRGLGIAGKTIETLKRAANHGIITSDKIPFGPRKKEIENALNLMLDNLCPSPCKEIDPDFWNTEAGELVAGAQYALYGEDYIGLAEAARMLYGVEKPAQREIQRVKHMAEAGKIKLYRKPLSAHTSRRKNAVRSNRLWVVRKSEIESIINERVY